MENTLSEIFRVLSRWENKGKRTVKNNSIQICHVPHVGTQAWFHEIYAGLSCEQIDKVEEKLQTKIPVDFREFYKNCNGLNIYSNTLSISGLKISDERIGEEAIQPYSIQVTDYGRPKSCPNSWLFFGSYNWDGSKVFFDLANGLDSSKVYYCERGSVKIKKEWPDFYTFLLSETVRLSKLFDENGVKLDEEYPTTPD